MPPPKVAVTIVTCNSARYIRRCLEAVFDQHGVAVEPVVLDNASSDGTLDILARFGRGVRVLASKRNVGFADGQNRAIRVAHAPWVLTLNPDVLMEPDFVRNLVEAGELDSGAGTVCGKLLSIGPGFEPLGEQRIDSTGIFFTPAMRHFDRGWNQTDDGSFDRMEYVFGATAAAALFRRRMIEDVSIQGEFFDPDFFVYREDADLAWRAQLMGWRCIYTPDALAYHVRTVTPRNRRHLPALINMHSVKNRILMRVKNATAGLYRQHWLPMTARDLLVAGGVLCLEPRSLPAVWHAAKCLPRALLRRRAIMARRRVADEALARWFRFDPASEPMGQLAPPRRRRVSPRAAELST